MRSDPEPDATALRGRDFRYGGLAVAVSSFGITRLFVAETVQIDAALPFLFVGLLPLVVGFALTVYGTALAVGPFTTEYANTVARWHLLGVGGMLAVFAVTALDGVRRGGGIFGFETPLLAANVLLGGAVGGTLTGIRSARAVRQRREIRRAANRALLVNRLLKHEVLNAVAVIDGYADLLADDDVDRSASMAPIRRASERITSTIAEVGKIASDGTRSTGVDVGRIVREETEAIQSEYDVDVRLSIRSDRTTSTADERVALVAHELLKNAAVHGGSATIDVELRERPHALELSITDDGPGLPADQQALLETGEFPEFDDPAAGFGLQITRLLVVQFGGDIGVRAASDDESGTEVTVRLPQKDQTATTAAAVGLSFPSLDRALLGGLLGGLVMGGFHHAFTGLLPVVGSLYGIGDPLIGWVTHLFHSAIFGLLFAAIVSGTRVRRLAGGAIRTGLLGLGWGTVLWLVAAGVIMPVWLTLVGIPTAVPRLSFTGLVGHAIWGVVLGVSYRELERFETDPWTGRLSAVTGLRDG